jgi:NAD(P)-dependent dehydrogenase (short-subunit alcohol dehydrogenase family)
MNETISRIALVTGANKGIGFEIARGIAKSGALVLLGARDSGLGEAAAIRLKDEKLAARFIPIDLDNAETFAAAAAAIDAEHGRLDVLVSNAGVVDPADGPPGSASLAAVRRIFEVNFFGTLALTQAMLPLLKKSRAARIVNVSSGLGSLALNNDPTSEFASVKLIGYNGSKAALNMLTVQLAAELKEAGVKVNSADPGFTATDLNGHRGYQTVAEGAAAPIRLALLPDDGPTGGYFNSKGPQPW